MRAAAAAGLDVVAITDHDTAEGWDEAERRPGRPASRWSAAWRSAPGTTGTACTCWPTCPTRTHPPLVAELDRILDGRSSRLPAMLARLRELGIDITADDVGRVAGDAVSTGRPHVADALVELGVVGDRTEAFRRYLSPGRPAYANRYAAPLETMLGLVEEAGGVSVIAHPWGRHGRQEPGEATLATLVEAGLSGIEVDHQDHDAADPRPAAGDRPQPRPRRHRLQRPPRHRQGRPRARLQHHGARRVRPAARPGASGGRRAPADVPPGWSGCECARQRRAAHRGLRDAVRDHGPGRHRPDLPVADRRPVGPAPPAGPPGRRSRCRSGDRDLRVLRPADPGATCTSRCPRCSAPAACCSCWSRWSC